MNNAERKALAEVMNGMSEEEKEFLARFIPSVYMEKEIQRRKEVTNSLLWAVRDISKDIRQDMPLIEAQEVFTRIKEKVG